MLTLKREGVDLVTRSFDVTSPQAEPNRIPSASIHAYQTLRRGRARNWLPTRLSGRDCRTAGSGPRSSVTSEIRSRAKRTSERRCINRDGSRSNAPEISLRIVDAGSHGVGHNQPRTRPHGRRHAATIPRSSMTTPDSATIIGLLQTRTQQNTADGSDPPAEIASLVFWSCGATFLKLAQTET